LEGVWHSLGEFNGIVSCRELGWLYSARNEPLRSLWRRT
jgi:hypothetical protein